MVESEKNQQETHMNITNKNKSIKIWHCLYFLIFTIHLLLKKNGSMDIDTVMVCGLSMKKPDFVSEYEFYKPDQVVPRKDIERKESAQDRSTSKESSKISTWFIIGAVLLIIRIAMRLTRD